MAAGTFTLQDGSALYCSDGTWDLDNAAMTLTGALFLSTSNVATTSNLRYGDLTNEVTTANGYTQGGVALTGVSFTRATRTGTFTSSSVQWTASGGSITARFFVIYANATLNGIVKPVIGYCLLDSTPADVTATSGQPFIVTPNASTGWFQITLSP